MRLGRAGAAHGAALRRPRPGLQPVRRTAALGARPRQARGARRPRRVHRGRLPQRRGPCDAFVSVGMLEHVGQRSFAALAEVLRRTRQARRRARPPALHRPRRAPAAERLDSPAHLSRRLRADACRSDPRHPRARRHVGASTSKTCACTTRAPSRTGANGSRPRRDASATRPAKSSAAPGSCISPAPRRHSGPAGCSCSRWSSRRVSRRRRSSRARDSTDGAVPEPAMIRCDAVVVGGGPAGSSCARTLSERRLERDRPRSRAVSPRQGLRRLADARRLPAARPRRRRSTARAALTLQEITGFRTRVIGRPADRNPLPATISYAIRRCEFDDFLLRRSGARVFGNTPVSSIRRTGERGWSTISSRPRSSSGPAATSVPSRATCAEALTHRCRSSQRRRSSAWTATGRGRRAAPGTAVLSRPPGIRVVRAQGGLRQRRHRPPRQPGFQSARAGLHGAARRDDEHPHTGQRAVARACVPRMGRRSTPGGRRRHAAGRRRRRAGVPRERRRHPAGHRVGPDGCRRAHRRRRDVTAPTRCVRTRRPWNACTRREGRDPA